MGDLRVRPYEPADRAELLALFGRAGAGAPTESLWGHPESEASIYLTPYLDGEPESVFVATLDGALVGYLAGSIGRGAVPSENDRLVRALKEHRPFLRPKALGFFLRSALDGLRGAVRRRPRAGEVEDPRWPAHLHINVEPRGRGSGAAQRLVAAFIDRAREEGVPGVYLQTLVENPRAVRFFSELGFTAHGETPQVPGMRHRGRPVHQLTMVRDLQETRRPQGAP